MYYLWTGGLEEYNHRGQHQATFREVRFGSLLREEHLPDADHILTGLPHQEYVVRNVVSWLREVVKAPDLIPNLPARSSGAVTTEAERTVAVRRT